jgi:hypothetical protein
VNVTTEPFSVGDAVVYRPRHGGRAEDGVVVGKNDHFVFVLYHGDGTAKATSPEDLEQLR